LNETDSCSQDELLARARAGDAAAFEQLVRTHRRTVYSLALRMLGRPDVADDLAQEVFLQLHRKLAALESGTHVGFWLRRVTTHRAIDRLREGRVVTMPLDEQAAAEEGAGQGDPLWSRCLRKLLVELAPAPRAVLVLRYQEDLDPTDIARVLEMPVNTVKSHLKRTLALLRERLQRSAE
jgi:RNA polymerase sigma-70 factor, ECF subfamily